MDHIYPGVFEPVQEVIENLLSLPFPARGKSHRNQDTGKKETRLSLSEKEEKLQLLEKSLAIKSSELAEREIALKERWDAGRIYQIPLGAILPNPFQPRREFEDLSLFSLANSIREHGILQPLTIRRMQNENPPQEEAVTPVQYELIAGERRLRAASAIGMETVPCIVLEADNRRAAELALIENLQRENLNMFEQASAIAALIDMHAMTQEQIAKSLAVSQSCIANKLRILRLTKEEREIILSRHLTERHARAFLRIKHLEQRRDTVAYIAEHNLNVAQTEQYIDRMLSAQVPLEPKQDKGEELLSHRKKKLILKDVRLFFNTIDHAVNVIKEAGIPAVWEREETDDVIRITILLPRTAAVPSQEKQNEST